MIVLKYEKYLWILFLAVILLIALYAKYYYSSGIGVLIRFGSQKFISGYYPYQKVSLPINITNNGGSIIRSLPISIYLNNTLAGAYNVSLTPQRSVVIYYNFTPKSSGTYAISVVADPAKLYSINNRNNANDNVAVVISGPQSAMPYMFMLRNYTSVSSGNVRASGYLIDTYLYGYFNMTEFSISDTNTLNTLLYPLLNITYRSFIAQLSYTKARYAYGNETSFWIQGYLDPSIMGTAAKARGLSVSYQLLNSDISTKLSAPVNLTLIKLGNNATLCSWYSGGWLKGVSFQGRTNCLSIVKGNNLTAQPNGAYNSSQFKRLIINLSSTGANFTASGVNSFRVGAILPVGSNALGYVGLSNATNTNSICYGPINIFNGIQYCSTYLFPVTNTLANFSLLRTVGVIGGINASVFSLVPTRLLFSQVLVNIGIIRGFNLSGAASGFISGFQNTCSFNASFVCSNVNFTNSNLTFTLVNKLGSATKLISIRCYWNGFANNMPLNITLPNLGSRNITDECYNYGAPITGIPLGLHLHLVLNYTLSSTAATTNGIAYII